jgi:hypothetical protein
MTRPYPGPKPFVFVMKRVDPEAAFQNPEDYLHTFSADDGVGYKLMAAIYDAKVCTGRAVLGPAQCAD